MKTRALKIEEYKKIMEIVRSGFHHEGKKFRPNSKLALALSIQANTGLRIGDVLQLTPKNFRDGKLYIREKKTDKEQSRPVHSRLIEIVLNYAMENGIKGGDNLFYRLSVRAVQKHLKFITDYLQQDDISTHSFRKFYAHTQYENSEHNIELVRDLLNHSSVGITQRYLGVTRKEVEEASKNHFVG